MDFTPPRQRKTKIRHNVILHVDTDDEVFEWWLVSPYLAQELKQQGEVIIDALGCHWWGRQSSGQAIYMDAAIQEIAGA